MPQHHPRACRGRRVRRRAVAPVLACALLLAACATPSDPGLSSGEDAAGASASASSSAPATPSASPTGDTEPDREDRQPAAVPEVLTFTASTSEGRAFKGASLAGEPVLLWFWAPWCAQCRSQIPDVRGIARDFDGRVKVVGVGSLDDAGAIRGFADEVPGVTHLVDEDGSVWRRFGILEQSSFVLLDAAGKQVLRSGYGEQVDLRSSVETLAGTA